MRHAMPAVLALLAAPLLSGCFTLVGGAVGSLVDAGKPDYEVASRADLAVQDPDHEVLVADRDGAVHRGRYRGLRTESGEGYTLAYERWRAALPDSLKPPAIGSKVVVWLRGEPQPEARHGELAGFDAEAVYLKAGDTGLATPWEVIERWTGPGGTPYPPPLAWAQADGAAPVIGAVELLVGTEALETVAWGDIRTVELQRAKHGLRNGAIVGLSLDVVTLVIIAATWDSSWGWN